MYSQNNNRLPALLKGKDFISGFDDNDVLKSLMGQKKKSKKEEQIDKKIEKLLETYKK